MRRSLFLVESSDKPKPASAGGVSCPNGWVGEWMCGDILGPSILLFKLGYNNKNDVLMLDMASKVVYDHSTTSYDQFFLKFWYIKPIYAVENS